MNQAKEVKVEHSYGSKKSNSSRVHMNQAKEVKIERCRNFIKKTFEELPEFATGIETGLFFRKAKKAGLYERGYDSPMLMALKDLANLKAIKDENGKCLYCVFKLVRKEYT